MSCYGGQDTSLSIMTIINPVYWDDTTTKGFNWVASNVTMEPNICYK